MTRGPALRRGALALVVAAGLVLAHLLAVAPVAAAGTPMPAAHAVAAQLSGAPVPPPFGEASSDPLERSAKPCALAGCAVHTTAQPAACLAVAGPGQAPLGGPVGILRTTDPVSADPVTPPVGPAGPPPPLLLLGRLRV